MCELILPNVHFSGLNNGLIFLTSLQRNKIRSNNVVLYIEMSCALVFYILGIYFPEPVARN